MTRTRLASELRELRARTGLSMAALAGRTTYSKSSWERYLNGKALPPRQAVRDLCRIAHEPEGRYLALWEIAEAEWSGRAKDGGTPVAERRVRRRTPLVAVGAVLAAAVSATLLLLLPGDNDEPTASASPTGPRCRGTACEGQDPMHMGCGKHPATLTEHRTSTGAWVAVRYSKACETSWGRMWGTRVGDRLEVDAGGPTRIRRIKDTIDAESYVYTPMTATSPGATVQACFHPATGRQECVDARTPVTG